MRTYTLIGVDHKTGEEVTVAVFDYRAAARRALKQHIDKHRTLYREYYVVSEERIPEFDCEDH